MAIALTQPEIGSTDWGTDVNNNWQELLDAFNSGTTTLEKVNFENSNGNYLRLPNMTSRPGSPANGMMIYNSSSHEFEGYQNGAWGSLGGGGAPGGSDTQVQFNDAGSFGGDAGLTYNKTTNVLTITSGGITVPGAGASSETFGASSAAAGANACAFGNGASAGGANGVSIGQGAAPSVTGADNTVIGQGSATSLTSGTNSTIVGRGSATSMTGNANTIIGEAAGNTLSTGFNNIIIGQAADSDANLNSGVVIGKSAALTNDGGVVIGQGASWAGSSGVVLGQTTGNAGTSTGSVVIGALACSAGPVTGNFNTVVGYNAAANLAAGGTNVVIGRNCAAALSDGSSNTIVGEGADVAVAATATAICVGANAQVATDGVTVGEGACPLVTGQNNTVLGQASAPSLSTGSANVIIGQNAAATLAEGGSCVVIGRNADCTAASSNEVVIGNSADSSASAIGNLVCIGNNATVVGSGLQTAVGHGAQAATSGVAIGHTASPNVTGADNTVIGQSAAGALTTSVDNVIIGQDAGDTLATGSGSNVIVGHSANCAATTANAVVIGKQAAVAGNGNIVIGWDAGNIGSTGQQNVIIGYQAAWLALTAGSNVVVGGVAATSLTSGTANTILGYDAGDTLATGSLNVIIGNAADVAAGTGSAVCVGANADAASNGIAIGTDASPNVTGTDNTVVGQSAAATLTTGTDNVVIGKSADLAAAATDDAVCIGEAAQAAVNGVTIGSGAATGVTGTDNTVVGQSAAASLTTGTDNVCIGKSADFGADALTNAVVIGANSKAAINGVVIGEGAATSITSGTSNVLIGQGVATTLGLAGNCVIIGQGSGTAVAGNGNITIIGQGAGTGVTGTANTIVGGQAGTSLTTGAGNVLLGKDADTVSAATSSAIVLGRSATADSNQFVAGSSSYPINDVYFGKGVTDASATAYTLHGTSGSGTDIAGANIIIAGGQGTGTGVGGHVILQTAVPGTTGSSLNSLIDRLSVDDDGGVRWTGIATADEPATSGAGHGTIFFDSTLEKFRVSENNGAYTDLVTTPGGADTNIQFNNSGAFDGDTEFTWDTSTKTLTVTGQLTAQPSSVGANNEIFGSGAGTSMNINAARNTVIGAQAYTAGVGATDNTIIGYDAADTIQTGLYNIVIGSGADLNGSGTSRSTVVGTNAIGAQRGVTIGYTASANVTGADNVILGYSSAPTLTYGAQNVIIGSSADTSVNSTQGTVVIGCGATGYQHGIVLGVEATGTANNQFVAGSGNYPIDDLYFGKGVTHSTPTAYTIHGTGGSGTDIAGADLVIGGGQGTGTGTGGEIVFQTAIAGTTGDTPNALADRVHITQDGAFLMDGIATASAPAVSPAGDGAIFFDSTLGKFRVSENNGAYADLVSDGGTPGGSDTEVQFNDGGAFGGDAGLTYNKTTNLLKITAGNLSLGDTRGVVDGTNNEQLMFTQTASAVNYINIANAATGNGPTISALGGDTNIDLDLSAKGTGALVCSGSGIVIPSNAGDPTGTNGKIVYNSTSNKFRAYENGSWTDVVSTAVAFPIAPCSAIPVTAGRVFASIHEGAGANSKQDEGMGVEASVGADSTWRLRFQMPPSLPSGTGKLRLIALAAATSGAAKVNPKWASVAMEEDPSSATLNAEGTSTLTWSAGDSDVYKELKITLDADTLVASEMVVMDLVFETTSWTLAAVSTWIAAIVWE